MIVIAGPLRGSVTLQSTNDFSLMDARIFAREDGVEPVIGPRFARTLWHRPGVTKHVAAPCEAIRR